MAILTDLPVELHLQILSNLTWLEKVEARSACKIWYNILSNPAYRYGPAGTNSTPKLYLGVEGDERAITFRMHNLLFQEQLAYYPGLGLGGKAQIYVLDLASRVRQRLQYESVLNDPVMVDVDDRTPAYCDLRLLEDGPFTAEWIVPPSGVAINFEKTRDPQRRRYIEDLVLEHKKNFNPLRDQLHAMKPDPDGERVGTKIITVGELIQVLWKKLRASDNRPSYAYDRIVGMRLRCTKTMDCIEMDVTALTKNNALRTWADKENPLRSWFEFPRPSILSGPKTSTSSGTSTSTGTSTGTSSGKTHDTFFSTAARLK